MQDCLVAVGGLIPVSASHSLSDFSLAHRLSSMLTHCRVLKVRRTGSYRC
jgi:hypothetical protein